MGPPHHRLLAILAKAAGRFAVLGTAAWAPACVTSHAYLRAGDANSAEVGYAGDIAGAIRVAHEHCAAYERVEELVEKDAETARFDCVKPGP